MKLQNVQLELFNHMNMVILTFNVRAREGRIGNYNVQSVLDTLISAVSSECDNKRYSCLRPLVAGKLVSWCFRGIRLI